MTPLRRSGEESVSGKAAHLPVSYTKHATFHVAPERCVRLSPHTAQAIQKPALVFADPLARCRANFTIRIRSYLASREVKFTMPINRDTGERIG